MQLHYGGETKPPGFRVALPRTGSGVAQNDAKFIGYSVTTLQPSRQFPPVFIEIAENEIRLAAVSFELAEFSDPHRIASGGKVAMSLLNLGFRSQLQSEAIHGCQILARRTL